MATIDILLPVRNGMPFLRGSIESVLSQTLSDWRLLILDHGSSDNSVAVARAYAEKDKRIEVFSLPDADGLGGLLNAGLERCDCRYVVRHDADDVALPNRFEIVTRAFSGRPGIAVIGATALFIDENGRETGRLYRPIGQAAVTAATFFYNPVSHPTVAIDLHVFKKMRAVYGVDFIGAVPAHERIVVTQHAEDYFLFGQLALLGLCANVDVPVIKYRIHNRASSIANIVEQLSISFSISRFLSRTFCCMNNLKDFDPTPFCNHGGHLFNFLSTNLPETFEGMAQSLIAGMGDSPALRRELAFRWVLATNRPSEFLRRYLAFELAHSRKGLERDLFMNWVRKAFRKNKHGYLQYVFEQ